MNPREQGSLTGFLIVHVGAGLVLAGIAVAASNRFGGLSVAAMFLAGWLGHLLFNSLLEAVAEDSA